MKIRIDKFILYFLVVAFVVTLLCGRRLYAYLFYDRTEGRVTSFEKVWVNTKRGGYYNNYPVVEFDTKEYHVSFIAPPYMEEVAGIGKNFTVLYNRKNPEDAYVLNFYGLWGESAKYLIPFFLIWTIVVLSPDFIPRKIVFQI